MYNFFLVKVKDFGVAKFLKHFYLSLCSLILSWRRSLSYRNQSIDLLYKSMHWFLYDRDLRHERVKHPHAEAYSEPCQIFVMDCFAKIVSAMNYIHKTLYLRCLTEFRILSCLKEIVKKRSQLKAIWWSLRFNIFTIYMAQKKSKWTYEQEGYRTNALFCFFIHDLYFAHVQLLHDRRSVQLTHIRSVLPSYKNQSIDSQCKSITWFINGTTWYGLSVCRLVANLIILY